MAALEREAFRVLYLDNQNQLIAHETLFTGTINRTEVHPGKWSNVLCISTRRR
jgi:DNA repair protein RadC